MKMWKLSIPFGDRDKAKEMGCQWDWKKKYWYFDGGEEDYEALPEHWKSAGEEIDDFVVMLPF